MKSEQKRIKHWLRTQQNKKLRDYPYVPMIDFWSNNSMRNLMAKMIGLHSIANKKK